MRFTRLLAVAAIAVVGAFTAGCANRTGDQTIAEYCTAADHANTDICKQHVDTENVRTTLGQRISEVFGVAQHAQQTADQAMTRQLNCATRTVQRSQTGSCENGAILTSCTQTRYTTRAGGVAILRSINESECRFNGRVLEMQVRCCTVGEPIQQTNVSAPVPPAAAPAPAPVS